MSQNNSINPIENQNPAPELYFAGYDPKKFRRPTSSNPLWDFFARSNSLEVSICQIVSCRRVLYNEHNISTSCWRHLEKHHREIYRTTRMKQKKINIRRKSCLCLLCNKSFGSNASVKRHQHAVHTGDEITPLCTWCGKRFTSKKPQYVISSRFRRLVFFFLLGALQTTTVAFSHLRRRHPRKAGTALLYTHRYPSCGNGSACPFCTRDLGLGDANEAISHIIQCRENPNRNGVGVTKGGYIRAFGKHSKILFTY
jgi:hypothetical protein